MNHINYARIKNIINEVMFELTYSCVRLVFLYFKGPSRADKNCKADFISSRLAGYWEKFSISNNRASGKPLATVMPLRKANQLVFPM